MMHAHLVDLMFGNMPNKLFIIAMQLSHPSFQAAFIKHHLYLPYSV